MTTCAHDADDECSVRSVVYSTVVRVTTICSAARRLQRRVLIFS